jgi:hypothetical protein
VQSIRGPENGLVLLRARLHEVRGYLIWDYSYVWCDAPNEISEESTASVYRIGDLVKLDDPSKSQQIFAVTNGATLHETVIFIVTTLTTSDQMPWKIKRDT